MITYTVLKIFMSILEKKYRNVGLLGTWAVTLDETKQKVLNQS